jgi:hypothetical protein
VPSGISMLKNSASQAVRREVGIAITRAQWNAFRVG